MLSARDKHRIRMALRRARRHERQPGIITARQHEQDCKLWRARLSEALKQAAELQRASRLQKAA